MLMFPGVSAGAEGTLARAAVVVLPPLLLLGLGAGAPY